MGNGEPIASVAEVEPHARAAELLSGIFLRLSCQDILGNAPDAIAVKVE
jgi:hypothetical protein